MNSASPFSSSNRRVYGRPGRLLIVVSILAGLLYLTWRLSQSHGRMEILWPVLIIEVLPGAIALYALLYNRVIISDTGIEFYQLSYRHSTTWNNIDRIERVQVSTKYFDALILREPAVRYNWLWGWRHREEDWMELNEQFLSLDKTIPLFVFNREWRTGDIGRDIQTYVPRLFTEAVPVVTAHELRPSAEDVT